MDRSRPHLSNWRDMVSFTSACLEERSCITALGGECRRVKNFT